MFLLFTNVQLTEKFNSLDTRVSNLESVIPKEPTSAQVFFWFFVFYCCSTAYRFALNFYLLFFVYI